MPRGIDLHIPFPSRNSPDVARATARHTSWPRSFGLLTTEDALRRHVRARYPELAARFYPTAVGADLDLGVDLMSWFFLFDDSFDGPDGDDPARARHLVDPVAGTLRREPDPADEPIVRAFADLWRRSTDGMSPEWRARAEAHWRAYLDGYVAEAALRQQGTMSTVEQHLRLRRDTIGAYPTMDLAERIGHFEVPERAYASRTLTEMHETVVEAIVVHNDLCSVEKEEARGDPHNLVLILEHHKGFSRDQAVEALRELIRERTEHFLTLEHRIPGLCDRLGLDDRERAAVHRTVAETLRDIARGDYDWAERSGRYAREEIPHT